MRPDNLAKGVAYVVVSMFLFAVMDAVSRVLTRDLGLEVAQILWVRFTIFLVFALIVVGPRNFLPAFRSAFPALQVFRACALVVEIGIFIVAFRYIPLADVHAVAAAAPLIVVILAATMLGERILPAVWIAVLVGLAGVLVVVRPGIRDLSWFHFIPVLGALSWGFYQALVRLVGRRDNADTTLVYTVAVGLLVSTATGPFFWVPPTAYGWGMLLLSGVLGAAAHYTLIKGYEACSAGRLQPYGYTLVIWAVVVGIVWLGEIPDLYTLLGAAIIVAAGLFAWAQEIRATMRAGSAARAAQAAAPPARD